MITIMLMRSQVSGASLVDKDKKYKMIIMINAAWRYWGGRDGGTTQAGDDPTAGGEDFVKICK